MILIDEMIEFLEAKKLEKPKIDRRHILREFNRFYYDKKYRQQLYSIALCVESVTGIDVDQMKVKTRKSEVIMARQLAMFFMKTSTGIPAGIIGQFFSTKYHSFDRNSVNWGINKLQGYYEVDMYFRVTYEQIEQKIKETFFK